MIVGVNLRTREVYEIDDFSHVLVTGKTGSGKTSLVLIRLIMGLLRQEVVLLVFDGGADPSLFALVLILCQNLGRKLQLLTDRAELRNNKIDIFRTSGDLSLLDAVNLVTNAASVDSTQSYGPQYFWSAAVVGILIIWRAMERRGIPINAETTVQFIELQNRGRRGKDDTAQLKNTISILLSFRHAIQVDDGSDDFVRWQNADVVYISFESQDATSVLFATTILESFNSFKRDQTRRGENNTDAAIVFDECDGIFSRARAANVSKQRRNRITYYFAAQSVAQIRAVSPEIADIILEQMGIQIYLTPDNERDQKAIQNASEEVIRTLDSRNRSLDRSTIGEREYLTRRITINEIRWAAQTPGVAILINREKQGLEEPILLYCEHLIPRAVFERLQRLPFPRALPQLQPAPPPPPDFAGMFDRIRR